MSSSTSYALRFLKRRLRSAWEVDQALVVRGVDEVERLGVLSELTANGLIDDRRFALAWVHTRDRLSPRGEKVLRMELKEKHVPQEVIDDVLRQRRDDAQNDEASDQMTEEELARKLLQGKMRAYAHLSAEVRNRRLTAVLLRRGFSYDVARRILGA